MEVKKDESSEFSTFFQSCITRRSLTLSSLSRQLSARGIRVSVSALSHWATGRRQPERGESLHALTALEEILGLAAGELSDRVGPPRPRGRSAQNTFSAPIVPAAEPLHEALRKLGFPTPDSLPLEQSVHEYVQVSPDGTHRTLHFRHIVRATSSGPLRIPSVHRVLSPAPTARVREAADYFRPQKGCALGRAWSDPQRGIIAGELILLNDARPGDVAIANHSVTLPPSDRPSTQASYLALRRTHEILIKVAFAGQPVPETAEEFLQTVTPSRVTFHRHIPVRSGGYVQTLHHDVGPGFVGLRWTWTA